MKKRRRQSIELPPARDPLEKLQGQLAYMLRMMAGSQRLDGDEWMWLATLAVDAAENLAELRKADPSFTLPLFEQVMEELRDFTDNFTRVNFLQSTRAARRQNPALFMIRR